MKVIIKYTDYPAMSIEDLISKVLTHKLDYGDGGSFWRLLTEEEYNDRLEQFISFGLLKVFQNLNKPLIFTLEDINKLFEYEFTLCLTEEKRWS